MEAVKDCWEEKLDARFNMITISFPLLKSLQIWIRRINIINVYFVEVPNYRSLIISKNTNEGMGDEIVQWILTIKRMVIKSNFTRVGCYLPLLPTHDLYTWYSTHPRWAFSSIIFWYGSCSTLFFLHPTWFISTLLPTSLKPQDRKSIKLILSFSFVLKCKKIYTYWGIKLFKALRIPFEYTVMVSPIFFRTCI